MKRLFFLAMLVASPAGADPLTVTKTATVVADGVSAALPKALPGATVDYQLVVASPATNTLATVTGVTITDTLSPVVELCLADLGTAGGGPVEFVDGNLLGLGLIGSGLGYSYGSLASPADGLDFSADGTDWTLVPTPDADGCDARVRAIRIRLSGTMAAGSAFRLRYRVRIR